MSRLNIESLEERAMLATIAFGQTINETIGTTGDRDLFNFSVASPTKVYVDSLSTYSNVAWTLRDANGILIDVHSMQSVSPIIDFAAGSYNLEFTAGNDSIGAYSFRLLNLGAATPITPGVAVNNTLSPSSETDVYSMTINAGDSYTFETSTVTPQNASWRLIDPLNREVFNTSLSSDFTNVSFTLPGTYRLLVEGYIADPGTVDYGFTVNFLGNTPVPPFTGTALSFGSTVLSDISVSGEVDKYIFTLASNKLLSFDTLATDGSIEWTLEGPAGIEVNSRLLENDWVNVANPALNLVQGNYQLRINGVSGATGNYSFQLLDLAAATVLTPGSLVTSALNPASKVDAYRFNALAGQRFFFDSQTASTQNAYWRLLNPNGQVVSTAYLGADMEPAAFTLAGQYSLLIEGYLLDTGTTNYSFRVQPVVDTAVQAIAVGATVAGSISVTGEQDRYSFTLASDSKLHFDTLSTTGSISWTLTGPTGVVVNSRPLENDWVNEPNPVLNLIAGNYQLTVDGNTDAVGAYSFRLLDLGIATSITYGSLVTGTLNPASATQAYRFNASAGDKIYFDSQSTSVQNAYARLVDPLGRTVFGVSLASDAEPPALVMSGQYTLLIEGHAFDTGTIGYTFAMHQVFVAPPVVMTLGSTIAGNISTVGERDRYTFTIASNKAVYFDALATPGGITWTLEGPTGTLVSSRSFENDSYFEPNPSLSLPAGNYQVTIDGSAEVTGAYSFRILDLAGATAITLGTIVTGTLNPAGAANAFRFSANAGDQFYIDSLSVSTQNAYWRVIDPVGNVVVEDYLSSDIEPPPAAFTGQYTLLVEGYVFDTGSIGYSFNVKSVVNAAPIAIALGSTVSGNIAVPGEQDRYTLTLASLSRLYVDFLTANSSVSVIIKGPGIDVTVGMNDFERWDVLPGTYEITIDGLTDSIGAYSFRVLDIATATAVTTGSPVTGTLSPASKTDMYRFTAIAGDQFDFTSSTASPQNASWRLLDPIGRTVFDVFQGSSQPTVSLTMAGTYTLLIEGFIQDTGVVNYGFTVSLIGNTPPVPFTGTALTLGTTVNSDISVSGEEDSYIFTLASTKRLYFDAISSSPPFGISWTLDGPAGSIVADRYFEYDMGYIGYDPSANLIAGNYRLTIKGVSGATGDYSFRMLDLASATPLTLGTPVSGSLNPATQTNSYRFTANAGDKLFFDSQTTVPQNASWRLLNSIGQTIFSAGLGNDAEPDALSVTGTYTLLVEGYTFDTGTTSFGFNVVPIVTAAPTPLTLGTTVSTNIGSPGEQDRYSFTLASNKLLYFDNLVAPSSLSWRLNGPTGLIVTRLFQYDWAHGFDPTLNLVAGNYTLTIDGDGDGTGAYSFRLLDYAGATLFTPGTVVNGTLNQATATNMHRFTAAAGDQFFFDSQAIAPQSASWRLINPLGQTIFSTALGSDSEPAALSIAGTYTILIEGYIFDSGTTSYSFNVQPLVVTAPVALTIGTTVSSNIGVAGEKDRYTFTLASDKRLYFDALVAPSSMNWSLKGPTGVVVANRPLSQDSNSGFDPTLNLLAGSYTLTIDSDSVSTGAYSFQLFDLASAASLTNGTVVNGTLNPATATVPYKFTVAAGEQYYFDMQTVVPQNAYWLLVDPYGRTVFSVGLGTDVAQGPLAYAGQYMLLVEGYIFDTGSINYSFRIQKVDPNPADSQLTPASIPENQPSVTVVGLFSTSDVDSTSTQTYALVSGTGSTNNSAFTITGNQLKTVSSFNFEAQSSYSIRVRTTDNVGLSFEKQFTINVTNVNETPTNIALSNSSIAENAGVNAVVG
ncbi:MAG: cadherin repeat domain-containing protein, partial [Pirellulaceae bacterium]|nr:cadherin repeat domain-containing protein [Pirellulaceae bacterium]